MNNNTIQEDEILSQAFVVAFNDVQEKVNKTAHDKGWYESDVSNVIQDAMTQFGVPAGTVPELTGLEDARRIALMHSELSEALEGLRAGNPPSDKIGNQGFTQVEEEFADTIIRIMDVSQERGWRIAEAIEAKRAYNLNRSHRHGGKKF